MRQVEISFGRGGRFAARLLEDQAPSTCEAVWAALPVEGTVLQARFSGEEMFVTTAIDAAAENQVPPSAGDIAFNPDPAWRAICIYYGPKIKAGHPFNLFARIDGDLEQLRRVGERIWREGGELVTIRPVQ